MRGKGNDSLFEINLIQHCLDVLNHAAMTPDVRYQTALILASLENKEIDSFLTTFLTKMSIEQFTKLHCMATIDIQKTEEFLKSNIRIGGLNDLFRDFLVPKNHEVTSSFIYSHIPTYESPNLWVIFRNIYNHFIY